MTKSPVQNLYQTDFALWIEKTVNRLKSQDYNHVDWENLIDGDGKIIHVDANVNTPTHADDVLTALGL